MFRLLLITVILVGIWGIYPHLPVAHATEIKVLTTADELNSDGDCSLREAFRAANLNIAVDACAAGEANATDTITVGGAMTYNLTIAGSGEDDGQTGDLDVVDNPAALDIILLASGSGVTINANTLDRILDILPNAALSATKVIFTNGIASDGGAIQAYDDLTLTDCAVIDSNATSDGGGIYHYDGTLTLQNTIVGGDGNGNFAQDGGGIYSASGTVLIDTSTISHNTGSSGGGIYSGGILTVQDNSLIEFNRASLGGGFYYYAPLGVVIIDNSIIRNNYSSSDGGGIYSVGQTTLQNNVIVEGNDANNNGGGIYAGINLAVLSGSQVIDNQANNGGGIAHQQGNLTITSALIDGNQGASKGGGVWSSNFSITAINATMITNNSGSIGGGIALEQTTLTMGNNTQIYDNSSLNGGGIYYLSGSGTITNSSIGLNATDKNEAFTQGGGIYVASAATLQVNNSSIAYNTSMDTGGGLYNAGTLTLQNNTLVQNNSATNHGGGLYSNSSAALTIDSVAFYSNTAGNAGGALFKDGSGGANISNVTTFGGAGVGNTANLGSAIYLQNGTVTVVNSRLLANSATTNGGAIYSAVNVNFVLSITNSCLVNNTDTAFHNSSVLNVQTASNNWWGSASGPGGTGGGSGDSVSANVDYSSFKTTPILGCPNKTVPTPTPTNTPIPPTPTNTPTTTTCVMIAVAPSLISPVHRAHTTDTTPTFTWNSVTGAQSYRLMIYLEDRSFEYKKRVFVTNYTLTAVETLTPAKYLWRVRTQDLGCATWTVWSTRNTLFVD